MLLKKNSPPYLVDLREGQRHVNDHLYLMGPLAGVGETLTVINDPEKQLLFHMPPYGIIHIITNTRQLPDI